MELWGKPFTSIWPEQKDLLTYYAGIFNGNGRNISVNDNNEFMYVGRLELQPCSTAKSLVRGPFLSLAATGSGAAMTGHKHLNSGEPVGQRRWFPLAVYPAERG